ncbi:TPA: thioredoxin [Legionella pneumophila]|nr:thioredoxin family protein [Legionella pneumophila]HAT1987752.1 thioredoxin family protein [Legionella pneumophila]HAT7910055.1 thioredoxin [Legionella pneumophila]HAT7913552.1 thioredoxin [Legionella pneumophila]HAT7916633.1 thioredoxin [Legionella pneumophila]HAT7983355.1 thioredoxin [Legionella pneumophila]
MKKAAGLWMIFMVFCSTLWASPIAAFKENDFKKLQKQNAAILVDVYAGWCSTCQAQSVILKQYQKEHPNAKLHILRVDFDNEKQWVRYFKAPRQGTLLLYQGKKRVWFGVGEMRQEVIFQKLNELAGA